MHVKKRRTEKVEHRILQVKNGAMDAGEFCVREA